MRRALTGLFIAAVLCMASTASANDVALSGSVLQVADQGSQTMGGFSWSSDLNEARQTSLAVHAGFGGGQGETPWTSSTVRLRYDAGRVGGEAGVFVNAEMAMRGHTQLSPSAVGWISPFDGFQLFGAYFENPFLDSQRSGFLRAGTRYRTARYALSTALVLDTMPHTWVPELDAEVRVAGAYWVGAVARVAVPGGDAEIAGGSLRLVRRF